VTAETFRGAAKRPSASELTDDQLDALHFERDQYASAIRHLLWSVRQTAYVWSQTLPDTVRAADVVEALSGIASHVPVRDDLRNDLWQRIVGAYYVRFENDGHPEDSRAAADEAMSLVQPELDALHARLDAVRALHQPEEYLGRQWCVECSVQRRTGPHTVEWVAFIPYPCPTLDALDGGAQR
jgi:hypothetical protein